MLPSLLRNSRIPVLVLLSGLLVPAARADNDWVEVRSPNFSVITDAGDKRGRDVALRFEQMRYIFGTLIGKNTINIPIPLQIVAFRGTKGFRQFMPLWKGKPITAAGLYQGGEDRNFILLDLSTYDPYSVVFHEYAHLLLNGNFPPTQPWFDEGFAEYYRSIKIIGKDMQLGGAPEGTADSLRENRFFHIADLFSVVQNSKVYYEDGDHRSMFYAQSWLVVHYLFDKNKLREASAYFDLVKNQNVPVPQAIERAFGMTPKQFDSEIEKYYRGNSVRGWKDTIPPFLTVTYTSQKLKPLDLQAVLADVHLHSPDYIDKAMAEFETILGSEPDHPAAHRGLGYAYLYKKDLSSAAEHFRRAAALDSNDARVHYYSALLINRQALNEGGRIDQPEAMMAHLKRAIQIDPELADAYNLLAYLQLTQGSANEAMESIKAAIRLSPRNDYYHSVLAQVYMAQRKWDEARDILKRLESSADPGLASNARANLTLVEDYKQNGQHVEWADLRKRNEKKKEWGSTPSPERLAEEAAADVPEASVAPTIDKRAVKFLKGRLQNVACLADTTAILTIVTMADASHVASLKGKAAKPPASAPAGRTLKLLVPDLKKVVVVGADGFSCQWHNQRVAVNYRAGGQFDGEVMSVEVQ